MLTQPWTRRLGHARACSSPKVAGCAWQRWEDVHSATTASSVATAPAAPAAWVSVSCQLCEVEKAMGTAHMGTAADTQWPVAGLCNEPISAQIWAWHHVHAAMHTNTCMGTDVVSRQAALCQADPQMGPLSSKSGGQQR